MKKRLTKSQIKWLETLYFDYDIEGIIQYVDDLCEYNFKQGMTLTNINDDN